MGCHFLFPPPEYLPDPGIELGLQCLLHWQAGSYRWATWEALVLFPRPQVPGAFVESKFGLVFGLRAWGSGSSRNST